MILAAALTTKPWRFGEYLSIYAFTGFIQQNLQLTLNEAEFFGSDRGLLSPTTVQS